MPGSKARFFVLFILNIFYRSVDRFVYIISSDIYSDNHLSIQLAVKENGPSSKSHILMTSEIWVHSKFFGETK